MEKIKKSLESEKIFSLKGKENLKIFSLKGKEN